MPIQAGGAFSDNGNVDSLPNKIDELASLVKNVKTYKECSLMCFSETWLTSNIPDANVEIPGFITVRSDRNAGTCGKRKEGDSLSTLTQDGVTPGM